MSQIPLPVVEIPPRPRVTTDMVRQAAEKVAVELDGISPSSIVSVYRIPVLMDGYELAVALMQELRIEVSREDMERMDEIESEIRSLHKAAVRAWFEKHDIQPPYPVGTRIKEGVIAGIYEYDVATYEVKRDGCTVDGRFQLIKFENAVEVPNVNA